MHARISKWFKFLITISPFVVCPEQTARRANRPSVTANVIFGALNFCVPQNTARRRQNTPNTESVSSPSAYLLCSAEWHDDEEYTIYSTSVLCVRVFDLDWSCVHLFATVVFAQSCPAQFETELYSGPGNAAERGECESYGIAIWRSSAKVLWWGSSSFRLNDIESCNLRGIWEIRGSIFFCTFSRVFGGTQRVAQHQLRYAGTPCNESSIMLASRLKMCILPSSDETIASSLTEAREYALYQFGHCVRNMIRYSLGACSAYSPIILCNICAISVHISSIPSQAQLAGVAFNYVLCVC